MSSTVELILKPINYDDITASTGFIYINIYISLLDFYVYLVSILYGTLYIYNWNINSIMWF